MEIIANNNSLITQTSTSEIGSEKPDHHDEMKIPQRHNYRSLPMSVQISMVTMILFDNNNKIIEMLSDKQEQIDKLLSKVNRLSGIVGALGQVVGAVKSSDKVNPSLEKDFKNIISNTSGGKVIYKDRNKTTDKFVITEDFIKELYEYCLGKNETNSYAKAIFAAKEGDFKNRLRHYLMGSAGAEQKYFSIDSLKEFLSSDALGLGAANSEFVDNYFSKYDSNYIVGYSISPNVLPKDSPLLNLTFSTYAEFWSYVTTNLPNVSTRDYVAHYADSENISQKDYDPSDYNEHNCYFKIPTDFLDPSLLDGDLCMTIYNDKTKQYEHYIRFDAIDTLFQSVIDDMVALFPPELAKTLNDVSEQINSSTADAYPTLMSTINTVHNRMESVKDTSAGIIQEIFKTTNQFLELQKKSCNQ